MTPVTCVDCQYAIEICDHAAARLLEPERSYHAGVVEHLTTDLADARAAQAAAEQQAEALRGNLVSMADALASSLTLLHRSRHDGGDSRACKLLTCQIGWQLVFAASPPAAPAVEAIGRLRTVAQDGHVVRCCTAIGPCCPCACDDTYQRDYEMRFPAVEPAEGTQATR